ncbi:MAG: hypothetical protein GY708_18155, partial [Actinomycetia bacterium]|nr:hypothetical protein [Actinomycetes bacterium]
ATGLVKVTAENLGSVSGDVSSDFYEFKSSIFSRESALAYVENTDLIAAGLDVSADSSSAYATRAEDNSITFRGTVDAHIMNSVVTAGTGGVTVEALDDSSFSATSYGGGSRSSRNDLDNDVTAYASGSTIEVTGGHISISADNQTAADATSTLSTTSDNYFSGGAVFAINVANGDTTAYADNDSELRTFNTGNISVTADNVATLDSKVKADATTSSISTGPSPSLALGATMAFNAVGWDMTNLLLGTLGDFVGDLGTQWLEGLFPFAESIPALTHA